jgi:hypothetical protein
MNKSNKSPMIKYAFILFGILIGGINAVLTAVFSFTYLPAAFGNPDGMLAPYLAAFYGLLIMDVAYLAWFYVYLRLAESKEQRGLSVFMAVMSLGASIMATITQLATNSFGLVDLTAYSETVGIIAMVTMIAVTALHIICFAAYTLTDPTESVKTSMTNSKADMLADALSEAEKRVKDDKKILVDLIAGSMRKDMLQQLGFTTQYEQIGAGETAVPQASQKPHRNFYHADQEFGGTLWFGTEEEARKSAATLSAVWDDDIAVFRKDGTKIAEYGGPKGGIDLMRVRGQEAKQPGRPTSAANGSGPKTYMAE